MRAQALCRRQGPEQYRKWDSQEATTCAQSILFGTGARRKCTLRQPLRVPVLAMPSAREHLLAGCSGIFGKGLLQLPERPQDATASCCCLGLDSYSEWGRPPCSSKCPYMDLSFVMLKTTSQVGKEETIFSIEEQEGNWQKAGT